MRIVAGTLRGRSIEAPSGDGTRPTVDRVREALFSSLFSLRGGFEGAVVLDAFAGSGALGIEALSRGAASAVFFEKNPKAAAVCKRNLDACDLSAAVVKRDILSSPPLTQKPAFDLIFLDPPYAYDAAGVLEMVKSLVQSGAAASDAIIVYEHDIASKGDVAQAAENAGFQVVASKKYGKTGVTLIRGQ